MRSAMKKVKTTSKHKHKHKQEALRCSDKIRCLDVFWVPEKELGEWEREGIVGVQTRIGHRLAEQPEHPWPHLLSLESLVPFELWSLVA